MSPIGFRVRTPTGPTRCPPRQGIRAVRWDTPEVSWSPWLSPRLREGRLRPRPGVLPDVAHCDRLVLGAVCDDSRHDPSDVVTHRQVVLPAVVPRQALDHVPRRPPRHCTALTPDLGLRDDICALALRSEVGATPRRMKTGSRLNRRRDRGSVERDGERRTDSG
jgi:hypothetical protein